jgi:hypothetical protein
VTDRVVERGGGGGFGFGFGDRILINGIIKLKNYDAIVVGLVWAHIYL